MNKYIWLFGENLGNTHNNNSYYFWKHVVGRNDNIDKYFVLNKTKENIEFYNCLEAEEKKYIIWKDSFKHFKIFRKADMYIVSLSYGDITPTKLFGKKLKLIIKKPLIYLQHGTIAIKKIGYTHNTYWNNMFRFFYYNPLIKEQLITENEFKDYQLYFGEFHPRYIQSVKYRQEKLADKKAKKKILFFITWREYFGDNFETRKFLNKLNKVFKNEKLVKFAKEKGYEVSLCLHQFFDEEKTATIRETLKKTNIKIYHPSEMDLQKELSTCDLLITDYSSLGFDCTVLGIPVMLFQPDCEDYFQNRELYCTYEEMSEYAIIKPNDLVDKIVKEDYKINEFFRKRLPKKIDFDYIASGKHIDRIYNDLKEYQENKITILAYNMSGRGGTVTANKALAESLLEKGYLVEFKSLKISEKKFLIPSGMSMTAFYDHRQNKKLNALKRKLPISKKNMLYFNYDLSKKAISPYIAKQLRLFLEKTNSKTIISTRETIHLFVNRFANKNVKNKIYYFHTDSKVVNNYFPNLMDEIKKVRLDNVVFVTESSKKAYKEDFDYDNYENVAISGNSLFSGAMTDRDKIEVPEIEDKIRCISLMRLTEDRKKDVDNIILFGKKLKEKKNNDIVVDIYGHGDLVDYLLDEIFDNDLEEHICYRGLTDTPREEILDHHCVIDFCFNQSFGMSYIESILNGRIVFARRNVGSLEVLKEIPESYYENEEELIEKIESVRNCTLKKYLSNYDKIYKRYSRESIANNICKLIKK